MDKFKIPDECILNIDYPQNNLRNYFSEQELNDYCIQNMKLYAIIDETRLNREIINLNTDAAYNSITFIEIELTELAISTDIFRIMNKILRTIRYQTIVALKIENKTLYAGAIFRENKRVPSNVLLSLQYTQWIYDDFIPPRIEKFFSNINNALDNFDNIQSLFNLFLNNISDLDCHYYIYPSITKILQHFGLQDYQQSLVENSFISSIPNHHNNNIWNIDRKDIQPVVESESLFRVLNLNDETKNIINNFNIKTSFYDYIKNKIFEGQYNFEEDENADLGVYEFITPFEQENYLQARQKFLYEVERLEFNNQDLEDPLDDLAKQNSFDDDGNDSSEDK